MEENKENSKNYLKIVCAFIMIISLIVCTLLYVFALPQKTENVVEGIAYRQGSTGAVVKKIQAKLAEYGIYNGAIDGIYGSKTTAGIKAVQRYNGLTVDGICGPRTARVMGIDLTESSSNSGYSASDQYLLAKCVYAEARGEPYLGQVAIAAVVLNRVQHPDFPNSISGVIYQPWAFTSVHDGQINLEPDASAKRAARDALNGWDPTNNCIYYYNPSTATSKWIWSRPVMLVIGKHNFAV